MTPVSAIRGSSPLARGLLLRRARAGAGRRIIPARAGFTSPLRAPATCTADHPRSRGVYDLTLPRFDTESGSSPLARGLRALLPHEGTAPGIIPARAGFTSSKMTKQPSRRDHPRSRGVYEKIVWATLRGKGSSPLARGLLRQRRGAPPWLRIIPARAGFTGGTPSRPPRERDHPRSRGVYISSTKGNPVFIGSSPLARGLRGSANL